MRHQSTLVPLGLLLLAACTGTNGSTSTSSGGPGTASSNASSTGGATSTGPGSSGAQTSSSSGQVGSSSTAAGSASSGLAQSSSAMTAGSSTGVASSTAGSASMGAGSGSSLAGGSGSGASSAASQGASGSSLDGTVRGARVDSAAPRQTVQGAPWAYEPSLNRPGQPAWTLITGPAGAAFSSTGRLTWAPSAMDVGTHAFTIQGQVGQETARQVFNVVVSGLRLEKTVVVNPLDSTPVTVGVDAPLSPIVGSAVTIPGGALSAALPVPVSISQVTGIKAPAAAAGVDPASFKPVEFGPTGTVFSSPVDIQLPFPASLGAMDFPQVLTLDEATGTWLPVPLAAVNRETGTVVASVKHFSTYVVIKRPDSLEVTLDKAPADVSCAGDFLVGVSFKEATAPRTFTLEDSLGATRTGSLMDLLAATTVGNELRVAFQAVVLETPPGGAVCVDGTCFPAALPEQIPPQPWLGALYVSVSRLFNGQFELRVHDGSTAAELLGREPLYRRSGLELPRDAALLASFLNGNATTILAQPLAGESLTVLSKAVVTLEDNSVDGGGLFSGTFAEDFVIQGAPQDAALDSDCDSLLNTVDTQPNPRRPQIATSPQEPRLRIPAGGSVILAAAARGEEAPISFQSNSPDVSLMGVVPGQPIGIGTTAVEASSSAGGTFQVTAVVGFAPNTTAFTWTLEFLSLTGPNDPPTVQLSVRNGLAVPRNTVVFVEAIGRDPDGDSNRLTYAWTINGAPIGVTGSQVSFATLNPALGSYVVECVASDGRASSAAATVTVRSVTESIPPRLPTLSPAVLNFTLPEAGGNVEGVIRAYAFDPDGPVSRYLVAAFPNTPAHTLVQEPAGASAVDLRFTTSVRGVFQFLVMGEDAGGIQSPEATLTIRVQPFLPDPVDMDGDGFAAGTGPGMDCLDTNATVHPGGVEVCGDGLDQDCSGEDLDVSACDLDDDGMFGADDCDETNRRINKRMLDLCDGLDNDCDGLTDELHHPGGSCPVDSPECVLSGTLRCLDLTHTECVPLAAQSCPACDAAGTTCFNPGGMAPACCSGMCEANGVCAAPMCKAGGGRCHAAGPADQCCLGPCEVGGDLVNGTCPSQAQCIEVFLGCPADDPFAEHPCCEGTECVPLDNPALGTCEPNTGTACHPLGDACTFMFPNSCCAGMHCEGTGARGLCVMNP